MGPQKERDEYNGDPSVVSTVGEGALLYRISPWSDDYTQGSFNPTYRLHGDPNAGRFDPIHPGHTGYIYLALGVSGAVGEGILRNRTIGSGGLIRKRSLAGLAFSVIQLKRNLLVSDLTGPNLRAINLSGSLVNCDPKDYSWSRDNAHRILRENPDTHGLLYNSRNNPEEKAVFLRQRNGLTANHLEVQSSKIILDSEVTLQLITAELKKYRIYITETP